MDLLLDGAAEEALRITGAVSVALRVGALVAGAARVAGLAARLQHAHQHRVPLAQRRARHARDHSLAAHALALCHSPQPSHARRTVTRVLTESLALHRVPTRVMVDGGLCAAGAAALGARYPRPRDLLAGRRPNRESESAPAPRAAARARS